MASLRKKTGCKFWFACFTLSDGKRVQRSTREESRKKAQAKADQWERLSVEKAKAKQAHKVISDIYRAAHLETLPYSTTRAYIKGWVARRKAEVSPATYQAYEHRAHHFLDFLGQRAEEGMGDITAAHIVRYRDAEAQRVSPATVNVGVKILRAIFEDARRDSIIADNPARDVQTIRNSDAGHRRPLSLPEVKKVLAVANSEWRSLIFFGLYTGQRLSDLARLTRQNIDTVANEIQLRSLKTGRVVRIPICAPLRTHLKTLQAGDDPKAPLHPSAHESVSATGKTGTLSNQFGELLTTAGLAPARTRQSTGKGRASRRASSELSFHSLRHTATSLMKNAGISPAVVQDIIGHDSAEMSAHYTHIDSEAKRKALESMPDLTGKSDQSAGA